MAKEGGNPVRGHVLGLGWAGLVPFMGLPVLIRLDSQRALYWGEVLSSYALAIICFLVGVWWGLALIRRSASALVLSNAVVVVAFVGHVVFSAEGFLLLCALLFPGTVVVERRQWLFRRQPRYYRSLRLQLTAVATTSLLVAAYQL